MQIDNRIVLALSNLMGEEKRRLDKIFIFKKAGEVKYFASDGVAAMLITPKQGELDFDGEDGVYTIPSFVKKLVKYKDKEENAALNNTIFELKKGRCHCQIWQGFPIDFTYPIEDVEFKEVPDVFKTAPVEKTAIAFYPECARRIGKALGVLGAGTPLFLINEGEKYQGMASTDNFNIVYCVIGKDADEKQ